MPQEARAAIPSDVLGAVESLRSLGIVELTSEPQHGNDGWTRFRCRLPVPQPNPEHLPPQVEVEVSVPPAFPFGKVRFTPVEDELDGFPHQSTRDSGGELCLQSQSDYPWAILDRLVAYVRGAIEWVADAAHGTLLRDGQPWELPDFRVDHPSRTPSVLFVEDARSLGVWRERMRRTGTALLTRHANQFDLLAVSFSEDGNHVYSPDVSPTTRSDSTTFPCRWVLLPSLIYKRHRCPRTFAELEDLCSLTGLDVWSLIRAATKKAALDGIHYILLGMPIPRRVGGDPVEVHWQALAIPDPLIRASLKSGEDAFARKRLAVALRSKHLPWGRSTNVAGGRLATRGTLHADVRSKRICLVGCGAVGSTLADLLVRGGASDMTLFDNETLEFQNLTRHVLGPADVALNKALALARRMRGLYPASNIVGFPFGVPFGEGSEALRRAHDAIVRCDVLIDCSTSEAAFRWASKFGRERGKRVIHIFINAHARMLTLCCSGRHASAHRVAQLLFADIANGRAPFPWSEYDLRVPEVEPGAGCWQATFPAMYQDIVALVGAATPLIATLMQRTFESHGMGAVIARRDAGGIFDARLETAFVGVYR